MLERLTVNLCEYGCGQKGMFLMNSGKWCCESHYNKCPERRKKNSEGLKRAHKEGRKGYTYNPKSAWRTGKTFLTDSRIKSRFDLELMFTVDGIGPHRNVLINERGHQCEICGNTEWLGNPIVLELDHINGVKNDNRKNNLRLLCPNCHSTTPTWRRKKTDKRYQKYTDDEMIEAISTSKTMYEALCRLSLSWGSKTTLEKIIKKYDVDFMRL